LEQIHGGAAGASRVWLTSDGAELIFWIWSCVELSQTRPKGNEIYSAILVKAGLKKPEISQSVIVT
jgi:hypothetical protein